MKDTRAIGIAAHVLSLSKGSVASVNTRPMWREKDRDIRMATSADPGKGWNRPAVNPVLAKRGTAGTFDCFHVATPWFISIKGKWWMFYCGARDHAQPYVDNHWPIGVACGIVPSLWKE